jgi:protein-disulfide isomerase
LKKKDESKLNNNGKKANRREQRVQQAKQQAFMKRLIWITVACVVLIVAIVALTQYKPKPIQVAYDNVPVLGKTDAPVKIVEFGDYKCPSCKFFSQQIEPQLKKDFIDTGIVSFYFMNYTILGPDSNTAALAAQSVFHQNKDEFWKFYDALYKNQGDEQIQWATPQFLTELAKKEKLAIDYDKLMKDIVEKTYQSEVDEHNAFATKSRITSTPTLLINGKKFDKSLDYNAIKAAVEQAQKGE